MILAFDCSTRTGWCVMSDGGRIIESGVQSFEKHRGESNGLVFLRFRKWLESLYHAVTLGSSGNEAVRLVAYEVAHFRGGAATELCVGLQTRVQEFSANIGAEVAPIPTTTLKKWATGSGKAGKADMICRATRILGRPPIDDNEADAVLLAVWAKEQFL